MRDFVLVATHFTIRQYGRTKDRPAGRTPLHKSSTNDNMRKRLAASKVNNICVQNLLSCKHKMTT